MDLLIAEARSLGDDAAACAERASASESVDDAREDMQRAVRAGEEMRDRLEEALDFAESDIDQIRIENALTHVEDALDEGQLALTSGEMTMHAEEMRARIEDGISHLAPTEVIDVE
jgi:hypothetical protein